MVLEKVVFKHNIRTNKTNWNPIKVLSKRKEMQKQTFAILYGGVVLENFVKFRKTVVMEICF